MARRSTNDRSRPVTERQLVHGWGAGPDTTVRLAQADDLPAIRPLIATTGAEIESDWDKALAHGIMAAGLRAGLREGHDGLLQDIGGQFDRARDGDGMMDAYFRASLPLVADHREHGIVGTLAAYPPPNVVANYVNALPDRREQRRAIAGGAIAFAKVKAVAVAEHARGRHLGAALLKRCKQVYFQLGYRLIYGQMPPGRGLENFYARQGFDVLAPGEGLDLWVLFGVPGCVYADQGERLFARWRPE